MGTTGDHHGEEEVLEGFSVLGVFLFSRQPAEGQHYYFTMRKVKFSSLPGVGLASQ